jgi:hypothetical protein
MRSLSPSLDKFAHTLKALTSEAFCEKISPLLLSVNLHNLDGSVTNMGPKVPFDLKVLVWFGMRCIVARSNAPMLSSKI